MRDGVISLVADIQMVKVIEGQAGGVFAARDLQYSLSSSPVTALRELYDTSVELKERIDAVLDRAAVARVLKPK